MRLLIIYNPQAGNGRAGKRVGTLKAEVDKCGIDYKLEMTTSFGHGREIVRATDLTEFDGIIAAGGDGTVFEVLNGYKANESGKTIPLGVIPAGTGNAFARELEITNGDFKSAVKIIASGKIKEIDVGIFTAESHKYYFLNILGFGFVSDVAKSAHRLKRVGNLAYILGVFYQLLFLKTHHLSIEIDGKLIARENIFTEISNTRYTGSTFLMAPDAVVDDGYLDIILLNKITRRRLLKIFPTIFDGKHIREDGVEVYRGRHIKINSEPSKILTPDGEIFGQTPIEVECLPKNIKMFWS